MELAATVLGRVQFLVDGATVDLGGARQRRLLAALLVHRGAAVSTDRLVDAIFGGSPPDAAWRTFRTYVARLRRALDAAGADGADAIITVPSGYAIAGEVQLDADRFEELLDDARARLDVGEAAAALASTDEALGMWTGPAYGEFADEEWARPDAVRLEELRLVAGELRAAARTDVGHHDEALAEIRALIEQAPLREGPRRLQMLSLYRAGRQAEALRAGRAFRAQLAEETGLEWSRTLADLEQMIIDEDPRLDLVPRGRKLRGYVLGEVLAETAHGTTYRASQPAVGRDVAITVLPAELADEPMFVRRFERHAQRIASIEHPHVVPLYDYWREPGGAYLVTRYLVGGTLAARLAVGTALTAEEATDLLDEVGSALGAAHERGVAHGWLGAACVLFDESGRAHLTGFRVDEPEVHDAAAGDITAYAELAVEVWRAVGAPVRAGDGAVDGAEQRLQRVLRRARQPDGFTGIGQVRRALVGACRGADIAARSELQAVIEGPNPYRGLHAFRESDAAQFFGRGALVDQLAGDLRRESFVALVGRSGSGKSSVVRAGLLAEIRASGAYVASMVPGTHPVAELQIALSRVAARPVPDLVDVIDQPLGLADVLDAVLPEEGATLVLLVDQLEEAVTMADPAERVSVFRALARTLRAPDARLRVVVTLRADFLGRVLDDAVFGPLVRDHARLITPLDSDELYEAIVEPAAGAGVVVEPELATALVADAIDAPGSLPLLQFALTELYERRVEGTMTLDSYRRMGGLGAPIAQRAEEVFGTLTSDDQVAARRMFARLVTLGQGAEDTRRRVPRSELATVPSSVPDAFGSARLLTFDRDPRTREPTVEIAHEALISRWPRLRSWVDDDRAGLAVLHHLTTAAAAWEEADRDPAELYRGSRLAAAQEWAGEHDDDLTRVEGHFLAASRAARDAEAERERRRSRRLRGLAVGLAVVAVVAVVAGAVAIVQRNRATANADEARAQAVAADEQRQLADDNAVIAEDRRIEAEDQRRRAEANADEIERQVVRTEVARLTAETRATTGEDPDLPILLSLEAYRRAREIGEEPPGELLAAMQTAVQASRVAFRTTEGGTRGVISPDGSVVVLRARDDWRQLVVIDAGTGDVAGRVDVGLPVTALDVDRAGERLAVAVAGDGGDAGAISIRRLAAPEEEQVRVAIPGGRYAGLVEFSPDGRYLAAQTDADGEEWSSDLLSLVWDLEVPAEPPTEYDDTMIAGWVPGAPALAVHLVHDDELRVVEPRTGAPLGPTMAFDREVEFFDLSPDGTSVLALIAQRIEVWPLGGEEPVGVHDVINPYSWTAARFTEDGGSIAISGADDEVRVIRIDTGAARSLPGNSGEVFDVGTTRDGSRLLAPGRAGTYLWDLTPTGPPELGNLPTDGDVESVTFADDGTVLAGEIAAGEGPRRVRSIDLRSGTTLALWRGPNDDTDVLTLPGIGLVAVTSSREATRIERLEDGSLLAAVDPCQAPEASGDGGRWLLLVPVEDPECPGVVAIIDPRSGGVVVEYADRSVAAGAIGPSGTIAEGLFVVKRSIFAANGALDSALELRDARTAEVLASATWAGDLWVPIFSADGRYVTIGSGGLGGFAFDVARILDGEPMADAALNVGAGGGVATFPTAGAGWLVTGNSGKVLRFYDLETGAEEMTLPVDTGRSTSLVFTPDGSALYYESGSGVMVRFPMDHAELAALAEQRAQRDFTAEECLRFALADDCSTYAVDV